MSAVDYSAEDEMETRLNKGAKLTTRVGDNHVRVAPPWVDNIKVWWFEWFVHWSVGSKNLPVPCLQLHKFGKCRVCEDNERLARAGDTERSIASKRGAKAEIAIGMADLDIGVGFQRTTASSTMMKKLIEINKKYRPTGGIFDPNNGVNILITKVQSGAAFKFDKIEEFGGPCPIPDPTWLHELPDLSAAYKFYSYNQQAQILRNEQITADPAQVAILRAVAALVGGTQVAQATKPVNQTAATGTPSGHTCWITDQTGQVVEITPAQLQQLVRTDPRGLSVPVMRKDQQGGWKTAKDFGITMPAAPKAPAPPPAAIAPPPPVAGVVPDPHMDEQPQATDTFDEPLPPDDFSEVPDGENVPFDSSLPDEPSVPQTEQLVVDGQSVGTDFSKWPCFGQFNEGDPVCGHCDARTSCVPKTSGQLPI